MRNCLSTGFELPAPSLLRSFDFAVLTILHVLIIFLDSFAKGDFKSAEAAANDYSRLVSDDYDNEGQSIDNLNIDSAEFQFVNEAGTTCSSSNEHDNRTLFYIGLVFYELLSGGELPQSSLNDQ
jgi:hypothetical protein